MSGQQQASDEHSAKPQAERGVITTSRVWQHSYGQMLIETCADGSVWIDGKPVPETLPGDVATPASTDSAAAPASIPASSALPSGEAIS